MAYQVPPRFAHGQYPTAADLNVLGDDVKSLYGRLASLNLATPRADGATLWVVNVYRWLWYETEPSETTKISDPSGVNNEQSLPDSEGAMTAYDLANLDWVIPGSSYVVTGARYVAEDKDP